MNTKLLLGLTVALSVASIYIYQAQTVDSDSQQFQDTDGELLGYSNYCNSYINSDIFYKSMEAQANIIYNRLQQCHDIKNTTIGVFNSNGSSKVTVDTKSNQHIKSNDGTYQVFSLAQSNPSISLYDSFNWTVKNLPYSCWSTNSSQLSEQIVYLRNKFPRNLVSYIEYKNKSPTYFIKNGRIKTAYRYARCAANDYYFLFILH